MRASARQREGESEQLTLCAHFRDAADSFQLENRVFSHRLYRRFAPYVMKFLGVSFGQAARIKQVPSDQKNLTL